MIAVTMSSGPLDVAMYFMSIPPVTLLAATWMPRRRPRFASKKRKALSEV
jgi:hypothetical protein